MGVEALVAQHEVYAPELRMGLTPKIHSLLPEQALRVVEYQALWVWDGRGI